MRKPYQAHPSAHIDGETEENGGVAPGIGEGTRIWHGSHVMAGARIGRGCNIGQNVFIAASVVIGDGCKIQNNVNLYDGVTLEDHVFCGPSMTFTNLSRPLPRAAISRHAMYERTTVRRNASIGAGAVIVCGHTLGESCFVAAGAVVVRDVPDFGLVGGNPAAPMGWVCQCGARLQLEDGTAHCRERCEISGTTLVCGRTFGLGRDGLLRKVGDPHEES